MDHTYCGLRKRHGKSPCKALRRVCVLHPYGCSQLGQDHENTQRALAALIKHPNAGGVLVLGLGCENNRIESLKQVLGDYDPERVRFLEAQSVEDELAQGERFIDELKARVAQDRRTRHPVSKLVVGLNAVVQTVFPELRPIH